MSVAVAGWTAVDICQTEMRVPVTWMLQLIQHAAAVSVLAQVPMCPAAPWQATDQAAEEHQLCAVRAECEAARMQLVAVRSRLPSTVETSTQYSHLLQSTKFVFL